MNTADTLAPGVIPASSSTTGHQTHQVVRVNQHAASPAESDELASEAPVALEYNGISHATVLASPTALEDLAYGFSYTEGIIRSARDIHDMEITEGPEGIVVQLTIANACLAQLKLRRRSLAGRTGCGLCGIESLDEVRRALPAVQARPENISAHAILKAMQALRARQPLFQVTGATHAAGWADASGNIEQVREDVGRHNALDKLIGHLLRHPTDTAAGFAVISSRASFEMVQKAAAAGINALVAVSAPTTYAVQVANELNVLLAGFARDSTFTVYTHINYLNHSGGPT